MSSGGAVRVVGSINADLRAAGTALDDAVRLAVVAAALATRRLGARGSLARQGDVELA